MSNLEEIAKAKETLTQEKPIAEVPQETTPNPEAIKAVDIEITSTSWEVDLWMATIETEELVEDWKTLWDHMYDAALEEARKKAEEEVLKSVKEEDYPEIDVKQIEKDKVLDKMTEEIEDIIEKVNTPEQMIQEIATELYTKLEKKDSELRIAKALETEYENKIKELQSENLKLKHWDNKVEIDDDYLWGFFVAYKDWKKSEDEKSKVSTSKKMFNIYFSWMKSIYPELDMEDIFWIVKSKKEKWMQTIQDLSWGSEKDIEIRQKASNLYRPNPFVLK